MQIAEQISSNGITAGREFTDALTYLVSKFAITKVIETGTFEGTGTTRAVLKGFSQHKITPVMFVSIEKDYMNYKTAIINNAGNPVKILNGLSIPNDLLPAKDEITFNDFPDSAIVDHPEDVRADRYFNETHGAVRQDLLTVALEMCEHTPELIILDSAGHIGTIEFNYLMPKITESCYIALDDTNHVKHLKTVEKIKLDARFKEVFNTDEKFGSYIFKYTPI